MADSGATAFIDAFTRVHEVLHRTIPDLTDDELSKEPHPSIGWLAWRLTRVMDGNASRLAGLDQLWIGGGWHSHFDMPPVPDDFGRGLTHTREQVLHFKAPKDLLLAYHDAVYARMKTYLESLQPGDLARELNEPQYTPLPTVSVRIVSVLENAMANAGQIRYLKAYHRLGGWFPRESSDPVF